MEATLVVAVPHDLSLACSLQPASRNQDDLMTASAILVLLALAAPIAGAESGATLIDDANGSGESIVVPVGSSLKQMPAEWEKRISSVTLEAKHCVIVLYDEPGFSGRAVVLNGRSPHDLADYGFDNRTASLRVVALGQSANVLELLATLIEDSVEYYELKGLCEAQFVTRRWKRLFVVGNERECRWEYLRLHPPQDVAGLTIDPLVSAKLSVRHCRRVEGVTIYDVAVSPRFECSVANRCSGLMIDFGRIRVLNLHVRVPATNVVRLLRSWKS